MFTVNNLPLTSTSPGVGPYAGDLDDLQLQFNGIATHDQYVPITPGNLSISTDMPSFIQSGAGDDVITDNSTTPGDVAIDPGSGSNAIQASSNPTSHDTIIIDAESDAGPGMQLTDVINGLKAGDRVIIKGLSATTNAMVTNDGKVNVPKFPAAPRASDYRPE